MLFTDVLKSVSRSFYLSLRFLPAPLRPSMSLGYLLCRAADTIADTDIVPLEERLSTLESFKSLIKSFPISRNAASALIQTLSLYGSLNKSAEGKLLAQIPSCLAVLEKLPKTEQALLQNVVVGVIEGMEMDLKTFGQSAETARSFSTKKELEDYLFFIGGEPGRFWTQLCLTHYPDLSIRSKGRWIEDGIRFGTGLQMINILRDLAGDLKRGRCYIPEETLRAFGLRLENMMERSEPELFFTLYHSLIDDTLHRLEHGLEYIFQIPRRYARVRAAVWWPLVLGLKTLARLRINVDVLNAEKIVKVDKAEVYRMLAGSGFLLPSNRLLERSYRKMSDAASSAAGFKAGGFKRA